MCEFRYDENQEMELESNGESFALASCTTVWDIWLGKNRDVGTA